MITQRLEARVRRDFGPSEADTVLAMLAELGLDLPDFQKNPEGMERVLAAVVLVADGNSQQFLSAAELALADGRDVLMEAGLAHENWQNRLVDVLGPA